MNFVEGKKAVKKKTAKSKKKVSRKLTETQKAAMAANRSIKKNIDQIDGGIFAVSKRFSELLSLEDENFNEEGASSREEWLSTRWDSMCENTKSYKPWKSHGKGLLKSFLDLDKKNKAALVAFCVLVDSSNNRQPGKTFKFSQVEKAVMTFFNMPARQRRYGAQLKGFVSLKPKDVNLLDVVKKACELAEK